MVKLTCLLKRREGMTPAEFHAYWRDRHGPLVAKTRSGGHVTRYEQHPRPLDDYRDDDDRSGYDGVTEQWFSSMAEYRAHLGEDDFARVMADLANFLDLDHLEFVLTERPRVIVDGQSGWE